MDYNGLIERLKFPIWQDIEEPDSTLLLEAATTITDLLARAEAAESRVRELETSFRTEKCENGPECAELGRARKRAESAEARAEKAERERDAAVQQIEIKLKEQMFANYINPYPPMMPMKGE